MERHWESVREASEVILNLFKDLPRKDMKNIIKAVKDHGKKARASMGGCWCKECLALRWSPTHDVAITTLTVMQEEFSGEEFDGIIKNVTQRIKFLYADLRLQAQLLLHKNRRLLVVQTINPHQ